MMDAISPGARLLLDYGVGQQSAIFLQRIYSVLSRPLRVLKYVTRAAIKMHNTIENKIMPIEKRELIGFLCSHRDFRTHLCLVILYTLLFAIGSMKEVRDFSIRGG
jgi:FtsH-binding integral membrane protein